MSYILRLRKGYIPGTMGYVIYSPGTAPRATCVRLFLFRFSIVMQKNNSFQLVRTAFPSFFFLISFFPFFSSKNAVFFWRCEGRDHWFHRSSVPDGRNYTACFKDLIKNISEIYLQGRLTAKVERVCLELSPLCSISNTPPLPESLGALIRARLSPTWHFLSNSSLFSGLT